MADDKIETVIDRFLEYVRQRKTVPLKEAAAALALTTEKTEQIASLLESNKLIDIRYGLTNITLVSRQKGATTQEEKSVEKKAAPTNVNVAVERSRQLEKEILTVEGLLKFFEKDLERRILRSEELLKELESKKDLTEEELVTVKQEISLALGQLAAFSNEVKELVEKEEQFYAKLKEFNTKLENLKPSERRQEIEQKTGNKLAKFLRGFVLWLKALFASLKAKPSQASKIVRPIRKKHQPAITFLGRVEEWSAKTPKPTKGKRRILETRVDKIKQHYWRKSKQ